MQQNGIPAPDGALAGVVDRFPCGDGRLGSAAKNDYLSVSVDTVISVNTHLTKRIPWCTVSTVSTPPPQLANSEMAPGFEEEWPV